MAFPVPSHLPRAGHPRDVSSRILFKLDEATPQTLNARLARDWLAELDEAIRLTKTRIRERVQSDTYAVEHQLELAKSVQARAQTLTAGVLSLEEDLSDPSKGLVPVLLHDLTAHSTLAQELSDAEVTLMALNHLQLCHTKFCSLSRLVKAGRLSEATTASSELETLLDAAPTALSQAKVMVGLKSKFRAISDRKEELLNSAYSKCVEISPWELIIRPAVPVEQSDVILPITAVFSSLSSTSLSSRVNTLRRDLATHYIQRLFQQPLSVTITTFEIPHGTPGKKLTLHPAPPDSKQLTDCLQNMTSVLSFLYHELIPHFPIPHRDTLPKLLCQPVTSALINHLLVPSIPSSFADLPPFLKLVAGAVEFEDSSVVRMLGNSPADRPVKEWADGASGHYERKRRIGIMEEAREIILKHDHAARVVRVEYLPDPQVEAQPAVRELPEHPDVKDEAWGLDGEPGVETDDAGWGLEDDVPADPPPEEAQTQAQGEEDVADAWGWNDDEMSSVDDGASWDDPWAEPADKETSNLPIAVQGEAKSRLRIESSSGSAPQPSKEKFKARDEVASIPKETYLVSECTREIFELVCRTLREGQQLLASSIFSPTPKSKMQPGMLLLQAVSAPLDLFRALYPVTFATEMGDSPGRGIRFANDCAYLSREVKSLLTDNPHIPGAQEKLAECASTLKILGDGIFDEQVEKHQRLIQDFLNKANGFTDIAEQHDECEDAVNQILKYIRGVASELQSVLPRSKYYLALGMLVNAAISGVLGDILVLPDITEADSHRLGEFCRILSALEFLFIGDNGESFVVAYVPNWLKFSYLTELLEASIADISYLFEEGALVDFDVTELVSLVRALFADTPLRTATISKLMNGHPILH